MYIPSLATILSCVFLVYIANSIWSLAQLFHLPKCDLAAHEYCLESYLATNPALQLLIYTSSSSKSEKFELILHDKNFKYNEPFEK